MADPFDDSRPLNPESAPSAMASDEPSVARLIGTIGLSLVTVGAIVIWRNMHKEMLFGVTTGIFFILIGIVGMLYHATRDSDQLVRRLYLGSGLVAIGVGAILALIPQPGVGDWFMPWGILGLLLGASFLVSAGRHELLTPWDILITAVLTLGGVGMAVAGLIGVAMTQQFLPRFGGVAVLGLLFWWAAIGRFGSASETGYRLGRILGWVGILAMLFAVAASAIGGIRSSPDRFFMPRGLVLFGLGLMYWIVSYAVTSDRPIATMTRRELAAYFYSPIAYLVLFGTAVVGWLGYLVFLEIIMGETRNAMLPMREPVIRAYAAGFFSAVGVMFVVPILTMRLFSEERRTGTLEVLLTAPVNEWSVVISKFIAALLFFVALTIPWGLFLIPLYMVGREGFDYLPLLGFYVALICTGTAFVAMGLFFSSITRNQIIAAVLTFAGMFLAVAMIWIGDIPNIAPVIRDICKQMSFFDVWNNALSGKLPLHQLVTFLSMAVFWLFLTTKVLEARKWS